MSGYPVGARGTVAERFWAKVQKSDGCWTWTAALDGRGYGQFRVTTQYKTKAHRFAFTLANGEPEAGMEVCHRCDTPACVRPDHLFLGTHADNMRDMREKGRGPDIRVYAGMWRGGREGAPYTHCKRGHELTAANRTGGKRHSRCRICFNMRQKKYDHARRNKAA